MVLTLLGLAYKQRRVALMLAYVGWEFDGFCAQNNVKNTVEAVLFRALMKTKLVESREKADFHICGRTDKFVSALRQVVSLNVRSALNEEFGVSPRNEVKECSFSPSLKELDYPSILNACLPQSVKVIAWAPVSPQFSARFCCKGRTYKYFFPKGNLNIQAMDIASRHLVGSHDFRNFCKIDSGSNVVQHCVRTVRTARVYCLVPSELQNAKSMCCFEVSANAFLRHQIRCIVAVLFAVGQSNESPSVRPKPIICQLLDVKEHPAKPNYCMATGEPLILCNTNFDNLEWQWNHKVLNEVRSRLQTHWIEHAIKSRVIEEMLEQLNEFDDPGDESALVSDIASFHLNILAMDTVSTLVPSSSCKSYRPLASRPTERTASLVLFFFCYFNACFVASLETKQAKSKIRTKRSRAICEDVQREQ
ncbi:tRNA pseudouridine synthase 3 [Trichuris trichiura]|uniref:tRNA pseudouridine synthase n=1 Tax=Trichuris trichiura TaxID=36087 RepID=A0A077Z4N3_TRITR|nr:tRNA pseudouridine synthase 3 [Trichuris trichiura]